MKNAHPEQRINELELEIQRLKSNPNSEAKSLFHTLFTDGYSKKLIIDSETGQIVNANKTACLFYGYSLDEITKMNINEINRLSKEQICKEMELAKSNKRNHFNFKHQLKNGEIKDVEVYSGKIEVENKTYLYSNIIDVTEKKKIEEELIKTKEKAEKKAEESEIKYRLMVENQNDLIVKIDANYLLTYVSPNYCKTFGVNEDEIPGTSFLPLIHPDDRKVVTKSLENLKKAPYTTYHEERAKTVSGWRWFAWSVKSTFEGNKFIETVAVGRDISEKKEYEFELQQAKERAEENERKLVEAQKISQLGNWNYTIENDTVTWSKELYDIFERSYDLPAPRYSEQRPYYTEESFALLDKSTRNCVEHEIPYSIELEIITASGNIKHIISRGNVKKDKNNKIIGSYGTAQDITQRKIMEQQLIKAKEEAEESEEKFSTIFNMSQSLICVADINTATFKFINPAFKKILGYDEKVLLSKPFLEFVHPDDLEKTLSIVENDLKIGTPISYFINRYRCKDGQYRYLAWNSFPVPEKGITYGIAHDITEQKKLEHELIKAKEKAEKSERDLSAIIENISLAVFAHNLNGDIVLVNESSEKYTGYSKNELYAMNVSDIDKETIKKKDRETIWEKLNNSDESIQFSRIHFRKDKSTYPAEITATAIKLKGQAIILAIVQDVTERKQYEAELIKSKEAAENANKLKTEFLNNMSHEIRTPLNGILGFSEILSNPDISEEKRNIYSKIIKNSGEQLLRVVEDILEISTLETKQTKLDETEFSLNHLLMEQYAIFSLIAEERNVPIYLKKARQDNQSHIRSDKIKINKILSNLIENAIKFTSKGSIEIGYHIENDVLKLYVKDTGIGISAENKQKIFERFSQEDKDIADTFGGLGLGLSICKENVELLGGDISLESRKGSGSTFTVTIPYKPAGNYTPYVTNPNVKHPTTNKVKTILVAEDEETNYLYIEALFEDEFEMDCNLIHAKNGKEALDICLQHDINLVLMDIKMPVMNGNEATQKIKNKFPDLPVIAQTAYSTEVEKAEAMKHGYDDFISKPLDQDKLFEKINKFLSVK